MIYSNKVGCWIGPQNYFYLDEVVTVVPLKLEPSEATAQKQQVIGVLELSHPVVVRGNKSRSFAANSGTFKASLSGVQTAIRSFPTTAAAWCGRSEHPDAMAFCWMSTARCGAIVVLSIVNSVHIPWSRKRRKVRLEKCATEG